MSFFGLKDKSEDYKRKFALTVSGIITGIIFIFWFSYKISGFGSFADGVGNTASAFQQKVEGGMVEFFKVSNGAVQGIKETLSKMKESEINTSSSTIVEQKQNE